MLPILMSALCSCENEFDRLLEAEAKSGYWTDENNTVLIYWDYLGIYLYYEGIQGEIRGGMTDWGDGQDSWTQAKNGNYFTIHDVYDDNEIKMSFTYENNIFREYIGKVISLPPTKLHRVNVEKGSIDVKMRAWQGFKGELRDTYIEANAVTADGSSRLAIIFKDPSQDFVSLSAFTNKKSKISELKYTSDNGDPYILYTAPDSIAINREEISFSFLGKVKNNKGKETIKIFVGPSITVHKMGVGLIHGLGDTAENCFGGLQTYLINRGGYLKEQVKLIDYSKHFGNISSFDSNVAKNIIGTNLEEMYTNLLDKGIVSSKYALVGHSMGGILSRLYAQKQNSAGVGAIITLDTPHYGSQLADLGGVIVDVVEDVIETTIQGTVAGSTGNPLLIEASGKAISLLFDHIYRNSAFYDLRTDSEAIMEMNNNSSIVNLNNVPVHAICSYMVGHETTKAPEIVTFIDKHPTMKFMLPSVFFSEQISKTIYKGLYEAASSEISQQVLDALYGESEHDGVVSGESQRGGLDPNFYCTIERDAYKGPLGFMSNAHHCRTNRWEHTYENISSLLQSPFTDKRFCKTGDGFKARSNSRSTEMNSNYEYSFTDDANTYVNIKTCALEDMDDIRCIHVNLEKSENIIADMVVVTFGEEEVNVDICRYDYYFEIPEDYKGEAQIAIFGKTENQELTVDYQTLTIN